MRTKSLLLGGIALVGIGYGVKKLYDIIKVLKACRVNHREVSGVSPESCSVFR